jgi:hypothetical protein
MALPTGVHKRGAVFHIQIKVPGDIRSSWPTPFYVRKSLGTEDRAVATAQAHRLWAEAIDAFAQARARSKPLELTTLTPALAACIVAEVSHSVLGADAQLEVADVMTENGIALFSIHAEAEGSTVKTAESVRKVPVSVECLRLGFLEFAQARKKSGEGKLFRSFHREGKVTPGEIFSEWMRDYRAKVGTAPGALNGHHRFRHTIRTALAALHIGIETADALTGHAATGSSGRRIYTHVGLVTIREALGRVTFPLELPRVFAV